MIAGALAAVLLRLCTEVSEYVPIPDTITVTVASTLCGLIVLLTMITTPARIDAVSRLLHVRGRTRAEDSLAEALTRKGSAAEILHGLEVLRIPSPLEAPDASLYVGDTGEVAAIPHPRRANQEEPPRVVVHRGRSARPPLGG